MTVKPCHFAPRGMRWPWYPYATMLVEMGPLEMTETDDGIVTDVSLKVVGPVTQGRVGIRRWVKHLARRRP